MDTSSWLASKTCSLQGFREKGQWLSMATYSLIEDVTAHCLGAINHTRTLDIGTWDGQRCHVGKVGFQSFEDRQLLA